MSVLIDTSIWSLALRRRRQGISALESLWLSEWERLVSAGEALVTGPIRQELLSGIRSPEQFQAVQYALEGFASLTIVNADYDQAARFYNLCRAHGISGSAIDLLLCAVAHRYDTPLFTSDADFERYALYLPIRLHLAQTR